MAHGAPRESGYVVPLSAMTTENLRREARVEVRVPVVLYRNKKPVTLETSDVSFKGLFVCTTDPASTTPVQ